MAQSAQLTEFYNAYVEWLSDNAPDDSIFSRRVGLCTNLTRYCSENEISLDDSFVLRDELTQQFVDAGLDRDYPFNHGSDQSYRVEKAGERLHYNPSRRAWAYTHATPKPQSEELTAFYRAYLAWIDLGASENDEVFSRGYGLCSNLERFACNVGPDCRSPHEEMDRQFLHAGLSDCYPFNDSFEEYNDETDNRRAHLNERRIAWVREHALLDQVDAPVAQVEPAVQSPELTTFYKAYANWLDAGAPEKGFRAWFRKTILRRYNFRRDTGLCENLSRYAYDTKMPVVPEIEMVDQFGAAGLNHNYPFNLDCYGYSNESWRGTAHLNPARTAWVREHAVL